uniref:Protein phosphatase 1, regulatory (inhibitor) subunit 2 n=1 Tax=Oncorhynchus kisutch TaxID=8019 RepID=A0A8C7JLJ9_ONCKI
MTLAEKIRLCCRLPKYLINSQTLFYKTGRDRLLTRAHRQSPASELRIIGKKSQKWDEMNILATYHPADKDYGLMKIDEPSTPYNRMVGDEEDEGAHSDSEVNLPTVGDLASKLTAAEGTEPRFMREEEEESSEEEDELTPEAQAKKKQFEMMRKMHYNEGLSIRMARQLIANEQAEEEDEDEEMKEDMETEDFIVDPPHDGKTNGHTPTLRR